MTNHQIPVWLSEALPAARHPVLAARPGAARPGDVCRVSVPAEGSAGAQGRLVLVLDVDVAADLASVMLTHTDLEIRTSHDVLVAGSETGLPFDLAMETDLVGPVALGSIVGAAVGRVAADLLDLLRDAVDLGDMPEALAGRCGMPLRGEDDARWAWKVAEGETLDRVLATHAPAIVVAVGPVQQLAAALRSLGVARDFADDVRDATEALLTYARSSECLPAHVLPMIAAPQVARALGRDVLRAIGPQLCVA